MGTPVTNRLVPSSPPPSEARENERNEQNTASHSQSDNRNEQFILLSLEVAELLGIWGVGITFA